MGKSGGGQLSVFIRMSQLICMWPAWKSNKHFLFWYWGFVLAFAFNGLYLIFTFLAEIFSSSGNVDNLATTVDFTTVMISGIFRYISVVCRGAKYAHIAHSLQKIVQEQSFNPVGPRFYAKPMQVRGKKITLIYYCLSMLFVLQLSFGPIFTIIMNPSGQFPLPFDVWQPVDQSKTSNRIMLYINQAFSCLVCGHLYLTMDAYWYYILFQVIEQFKLIGHSYENLMQKDGATDAMVLPEHTEKVMYKCLAHHKKIRRFIGDMEDFLHPIVLVDFLHGVISMTFLALDITIALSKNDMAKVLYLTEYLIVSIVHMFCFDYLSNEMALQEIKLARSIYATPWYLFPKKMARNMLLAASVARKPLRLTGGKFFYLSLEFFVQTMRAIFSYITVLLQLSSEK